MASVRKEIMINARPEDVWDAVRDVGALHTRLVPGFVTGTRLEAGARVVTFFTGGVARELLVDIDDEARRLVWSVVESPLGLTHHNASAQVFADGPDRTRFVWIADVLPDEAAGPMGELMAHGIAVVKTTMEPQPAVS
jgi:Polyketide cyclase / dehydrase and lipid transport